MRTAAIVWAGLPVLAWAHPGNGIVVVEDGTVFTGDAVHDKLWRFKRGQGPVAEQTGFHCHWLTRGLDGRLYAERIAPETQPMASSFTRIDGGDGSWLELMTVGPQDSGVFLVDKEATIVAYVRGALREFRAIGTNRLYRGVGRPAAGQPSLGGVKAMCWGNNGEVLLTDGPRLWSVDRSGTMTVRAELKGAPWKSLYATRAGRRNIWGVAVDKYGRVLLADASRAQVLRIDSNGKLDVVANSRDGWIATGVATQGDDIYLLESKLVGNTNYGPRVSVLTPSGRPEVLGTVRD